MNPRLAAVHALTSVIRDQKSLSSHFDELYNKVGKKNRGFYHELCLGCLRHFDELKFIADYLVSKPLRAKNTDVFATVLIGLYQIKYLRVPDHAAIGETVNVVKSLKKVWAVKLVNAVLRNYLREQNTVEAALDDNGAKYSHPAWLMGKIKKAWPQHWQAILQANNQAPPLTLRVNQRKTSRDALLKLLHESEIETAENAFSETAITLTSNVEVVKIPGYESGFFSVQDEAAQFAATLLELKNQQRVLDACCAPGGKTAHILEQNVELKSLLAVDADEKRLQRVNENLNRLGHTATLKVADMTERDTWFTGEPFDRILADVPCSATGVIRRHPDIKLLRQPEDIAALCELQRAILQSLWQTLAIGGRLVYATCSVLPAENVEQVRWFLENTQNAKHIPIDAKWGIEQTFGRQLFPQPNGHDGFYYAIIEKA